MSKGKHLQKMALVLLIILLFCVGLYSYSTSLKANMESSACDTLNELTQQQRFNINLKIEMDINSIKSIAQAVKQFEKAELKNADFLKELRRNTSFKYLAYIDATGNGYSDNGQTIQTADRDYFIKAMNGQTLMSTPVVSRLDEKSIIIPISTPVYTDDKVSGVLLGVYNVNSLSDMILPSYGGEGFAYITNNKGDIIIPPKSEKSLFTHKYGYTNIFTGFENCEILAHDNLETIKLNVENEITGQVIFKMDNMKRYSHYAPLAVNGWYLFMVVPEHAILRQAQSIIQNSVLLAAAVVALVAVFLVSIVILQRRRDKEREEHTRILEKAAYYDDVTGAPTLYRFTKLVNKEMVERQLEIATLFKFDITNFKLVNEIYGFETGNKVLKAVIESVDAVAQESNCRSVFCSRINADEFVLFDATGDSAVGASNRWDTFVKIFSEKSAEIVRQWRFEFCCGRYFVEAGERDISKAIEKVNLAHRTAKKSNLNAICNYDELLRESYIEKIDIENQMEDALKYNEFKVYLQPKFCLDNEKIAGAEALVRWQLASGKIIPPNKFIHIFESNGFIIQLDFYMFENVCQLIQGWINSDKPVVPVSVNFSRLHLTNPDFVAQLVEIANKYNVPKNLLEVELTESVFFENAEIIENLILELRSEGFSLSIDDFGTGYSSLGLLKDLPVDVIKIDQSFFSDNKYGDRARFVIESVIQMAKKLNVYTVAEGVETIEHVELLRSVGCDVVQGYYYARPLPAEEFVLHK